MLNSLLKYNLFQGSAREPLVESSLWYCAPRLQSDIREYQEEFETGTEELEGTSTTRRPDAISLTYLTAFSVGPVSRSDSTQGLVNRAWRIDATVYGEVKLYRSAVPFPEMGEWDDRGTLFTYTGPAITEVDLGFDQNGNVFVCAERPTGPAGTPEVWIYWFSTLEMAFVFERLTAGRNPRVLLDDPHDVDDSDILLFYVSDDNDRIELRQQRDFYTEVHPTPVTDVANKFLEDVVRSEGNRVHAIYSAHNPATGQYAIESIQSAPYPIRLNESYNYSHNVEILDVIQVIMHGSAQPNSYDYTHEVGSVEVVELVMEESAGVDEYTYSHAIDLVEVIVLIIHTSAEAEGYEYSHRIETVDVQLFVLRTPELDPDPYSYQHQIDNVSLVPA